MDAPTTTTKLSILDFPLELRLQIYNHIFHDLSYFCFYSKPRNRDYQVQDQIYRFRAPLGTLHSNRQIRAEALPIFQRNLSLHSWVPSTITASTKGTVACPEFIFSNAARLINPTLGSSRLLREQIAQSLLPPRVTFILKSGAALYLDDGGGSTSTTTTDTDGRDHLAARLRGDDDKVALSKALIHAEYQDLRRSPLCNAVGERVCVHFVHEVLSYTTAATCLWRVYVS